MTELPLTPSQTVGPYFEVGLTGRLIPPELVAPDTPGAIRIRGRVLDGAGEPVPDGMVELWQANAAGSYESPGGFGRSGTGDDGGFEFVTVKPGPVAGQAPHIAVGVFARGLNKRLATRIYFPDEEAANAADPVLSSLEPKQGRPSWPSRSGKLGVRDRTEGAGGGLVAEARRARGVVHGRRLRL